MTHTPTFLGQNRPLNTCLIQTDTAAEARDLARNGALDGCDAFALQLEARPPIIGSMPTAMPMTTR